MNAVEVVPAANRLLRLAMASWFRREVDGGVVVRVVFGPSGGASRSVHLSVGLGEGEMTFTLFAPATSALDVSKLLVREQGKLLSDLKQIGVTAVPSESELASLAPEWLRATRQVVSE